jgi:hypothetical protein
MVEANPKSYKVRMRGASAEARAKRIAAEIAWRPHVEPSV